MIWRCEIWNGYGDKGRWTEVEIVGNDFNFLRALHKRFGRGIAVRNVKFLNPVTGKWEEWKGSERPLGEENFAGV